MGVVGRGDDGFSIQEQLLCRNMQRFRRELEFKAHKLLYHSTPGLRIMQKKEEKSCLPEPGAPGAGSSSLGFNPGTCVIETCQRLLLPAL